MKPSMFIQTLRISIQNFPHEYRSDYFKRIIYQIVLNLLDLIAISMIVISVSNSNLRSVMKFIPGISGILNNIRFLVAACCLVFILKGALALLLLNSNRVFFSNISREIASANFIKIQNMKADELANLDKAKMTRNFLKGYEDIFLILYGAIPVFISESFLILIIFLGVILVSPLSSTILSISFFLSVIFLSKKFTAVSKKTGKDYSQGAISMMNALTEQFVMFREYRLQGGERGALLRFEKHFGQMISAKGIYLVILGSPKYLLEIILFTFLFIILILQDYIFHNFQIFNLGIFLACGLRVLPSLLRINNAVTQMQAAYSSYTDFGTFELKKKHLFIEKVNAHPTPDLIQSRDFDSLISISNLTFQHDQSSVPLTFPDIEIKRGECVALIGKSGSGKSTLIDLLCGFLEPLTGSIKIDGVTVQEYVAVNPGKVALVPQENYIIEGDLFENIALFELNPNRERVLQLVMALNLENLLELDTRSFLTTSSQLSGGQKQRICTARALYFDPKILIVDEATSALDEENASNVLNLILSLRSEMTVIYSTHNNNHMARFNRVINLQ